MQNFLFYNKFISCLYMFRACVLTIRRSKLHYTASVSCTKFLFYNKFISCLYMFRACVLTIRRSKLHYTASGIITPIGCVMPLYHVQNFCFTINLFHASTCFEHVCSPSGGQNCITQPLVSSHL